MKTLIIAIIIALSVNQLTIAQTQTEYSYYNIVIIEDLTADNVQVLYDFSAKGNAQNELKIQVQTFTSLQDAITYIAINDIELIDLHAVQRGYIKVYYWLAKKKNKI